MQKSTLTTIGAFVAAGLASLCCVGPLVLALVGVTGLGAAGLALTFFEPYRPYLTGVTALLLGLGFFMTYRKKEENCGEGKACVAPTSPKMRKAGLWVVTGLAGLMLAFPYLPVSGTSSAPTASATQIATFTVEGMDCAACASGIAASLTQNNGIAEATINYEKRTATVIYTAGVITADRIAELITKQGFVATVAGKPIGVDTKAERAN